ncbi:MULTISPECIES: restriction endonuclease subunit S [Providencia]|uniref:Restriction endonuclease subunit S n=1 Tax=Providencia rettgeri TaxID=587 RepID=A0AAE2ZET7_PRORE|nr:restriction endonuclease subunit S [Providencia rettgeri]MBW3116633.1 restriction endonuclease subunit S [Providencia rettgeri]NHN50964.1 restriction endonuclease subunit S [Providencia rettgeri]
MTVEKLITDHIDIWSSALQTRSTAGRGSNGKIDLYGIKKLRELILELAVRGKLVPQNPNDEPASELLKRITAEKAELVKQGKIKKQKPLPEISDDEKPFELPEGWEWVTLATIGEIVGGGTPTSGNLKYWTTNGIKWLTPADLNSLKGKYISSGARDITNDGLSNSSARLMPKGTVLFSSRAPIGYVAISNTELSTNQGFKSCVPYIKECAEYIYYFLLSAVKEINAKASGTTFKEVSGAIVSNILLPFPPLNEQLKIVRITDNLMSLCDQLEQQSLTNLDAHQQLVDTLLTTLTESQNAEESAENWALISQHFDTLFTTEASIDALKQTILQLAVMGKLVPQDPNDEPASELLKRIEQEKAQMVKDGKIKKRKPLPPISDEEKPFELPQGWEWCKFGLLSEFINGDRGTNYPNKNEYVDSGIPWINTGHIEKDGTLSVSDMNYITQKKFDELRGGKIQCGDLVYCLRGATFGKTSFVTPYKIGAIASSLMIIRPFITQLGLFFYNYLTSPFGKSQVFRFDNGSAQPNLSANSVMLYAFPCPPLDEQFRIYNKIQELFGICESLKTNIQSAQQTQLHLADALTDAALN